MCFRNFIQVLFDEIFMNCFGDNIQEKKSEFMGNNDVQNLLFAKQTFAMKYSNSTQTEAESLKYS